MKALLKQAAVESKELLFITTSNMVLMPHPFLKPSITKGFYLLVARTEHFEHVEKERSMTEYEYSHPRRGNKAVI